MPRAKAVAKRKKVAIIGFTQHNNVAPWNDPDWELWGLNDLHSAFEQFRPGIFTNEPDRVRWFQIHHDRNGEYPGARDPEHTKWLQNTLVPVYTFVPNDEIKSCVRYPINEILRAFPRAYFNNSISWMIALAIYEGFETIGLYGVDMAIDGVHGQSEYAHQRPSVEYFVGIAEGRGIEFLIPEESEICKTGALYGWDNYSPLRVKLLGRIDQLTQQEAELVNQYEAVKRALHEVRGALNDCKWCVTNYLPGDGQFQDVPRVERAITRADLLPAGVLAQSDGRRTITKPQDNRMRQVLEAMSEVPDAS